MTDDDPGEPIPVPRDPRWPEAELTAIGLIRASINDDTQATAALHPSSGDDPTPLLHMLVLIAAEAIHYAADAYGITQHQYLDNLLTADIPLPLKSTDDLPRSLRARLPS